MEDVREWLDKLIANREEIESLINFSNDIELCFNPSKIFQIYTGLEIIADEIGAKVTHENYDWNKFPHKLYFSYRGYVFFQLLSEKEYIGDE